METTLYAVYLDQYAEKSQIIGVFSSWRLASDFIDDEISRQVRNYRYGDDDFATQKGSYKIKEITLDKKIK